MATQIVKQPNGKYCIYNTIIDDVTVFNCTKSDIIELRCKEARQKIVEEVNEVVSKLDNCEKPYYQFTLTFEEVLQNIKEKEHFDYFQSSTKNRKNVTTNKRTN